MIGIFDSGSGGMSVYREIVKRLPEERYVYFADNAHCPYGEKTAEYIRGRARVITETLLGKGADIVVVACNTATAAAIRTLRAEYPATQFIGMEPAVKPASLGTRTGVVGVLATAGTLKSPAYRMTRGKFGQGVKILGRVGEGFVELVESGELSGAHAEEVVRRSLQPLLEAGADTIVLGCTHYPFLMDVMKSIAGPSTVFLDPAPAVARRLVDVMQREHLLPSQESPGIELISSGDPSSLERIYRLVAGAAFSRQIPAEVYSFYDY